MREQIIIKRERSFSESLFFSLKKLPNFKLVFLLALALFLVFADIKRNSTINHLRGVIKNIVYSQKFLYGFKPADQGSNIDSPQSPLLQSLLLEQYSEENQRLRNLLNFIINNNIKINSLYTAQALIDFNNHIITFPYYENSQNKTGFSISPGQLIINEYGIIGKIASVEKRIISGILLTHPQFRLQVISGKSNYQFIIAGTGKKNLLKTLYLPEGARLIEGELIISAGNNINIAGKNLILGKVKSLNSQGSLINLLKRRNSSNSTETYEIEPAFIEGKLNFVSVLAQENSS